MKTVELHARVRHAVLIEGLSERAAADRFGINARTVSKMTDSGCVEAKLSCGSSEISRVGGRSKVSEIYKVHFRSPL